MNQEFHDRSLKLTHEQRVALGKRGAIRSGATPYSDEEVKYLVDNYGLITLKQIAVDLNRTYYSVVDKRKKLGLAFSINFYSNAEDEYIFANAKKLTQLQVAKNLGRSRNSIARRAVCLDVRFIKAGADSPKAKYSNEDIELIRELNDEGLTYTEIAIKFEIGKSYIREICLFEKRLYESSDLYHQMLELQDQAVHGLD